MKIELVNWEKYNPRKNAKKWSWFRLENDFLEVDDLFDLGQTELLLFIYLCCRRSKSAKPVFDVSVRKAVTACRAATDEAIVQSLRSLERLGKIAIHEEDTNADVREGTQTNADVREGTQKRPTLRYDTYDTNKEPPKSAPEAQNPGDTELAQAWFEMAKRHSTTVRYSAKWPQTVRQLRELDKISLEDLQKLLVFVEQDSFWRDNALSLPALRVRSKSNHRLKVENALASMRKPQGPPPPPPKPKSRMLTAEDLHKW